ncbi:putative CocE/NonD family hydrolase [Streptomyces canus]|uniref:CocE/NonD family hydrolase n=1 Tax=Streptomyces canus TaxID=58343 RepID=UPI0027895528|nr:CocE/NonD family hydrolase [Streptomyces canus]MDQ0596128.1 putative CocE/NonD family hydrolase [Streptomyces canus]
MSAGPAQRTVAGPLLSRLACGKQMPWRSHLDPLAAARRGFIVVLQDTRGRFASEGEREPWTHEESDGYDTVRWAVALPGANGSVGMNGASHFGNTQWMAALSKPPELKAIAPMVTWSDPDGGLWTRGGAIELGITADWTLLMGADALMRRHGTAQPVRRRGSRRRVVMTVLALSGLRDSSPDMSKSSAPAEATAPPDLPPEATHTALPPL